MYEKEILLKAKAISNELISLRRDIHSHPEMGLEEIRTSQIAMENLEKLGIEVQNGIGQTGVVGILRGKFQGKTIILRADMDCLKIEEKNDISYKSQNNGFMHACGHDVHTAWLVGAAKILCDFKEVLHGNIKFVFQPAEEALGGAKLVIEEGVLENPKVDAVIGAHVWPYLQSGRIGIKQGPIMAATDNFKLTIFGKGGHGAHPHKCIDPIVSATEIFMAFQTIVSRNIDPLEPAVITVGKFNSGSAHNIIPDNAYMEGTVRTLSLQTRRKIPELMEKVISGITSANGTKYKLEFVPYHPPVINEKELTSKVEKSIEDILGKDCIEKIEVPSMAGEDFSYFQEKVPGTFFWIGIGDEEKGTDMPLHASNFMVDEEMISIGAAVLAKSALDFLNL